MLINNGNSLFWNQKKNRKMLWVLIWIAPWTFQVIEYRLCESITNFQVNNNHNNKFEPNTRKKILEQLMNQRIPLKIMSFSVKCSKMCFSALQWGSLQKFIYKMFISTMHLIIDLQICTRNIDAHKHTHTQTIYINVRIGLICARAHFIRAIIKRNMHSKTETNKKCPNKNANESKK